MPEKKKKLSKMGIFDSIDGLGQPASFLYTFPQKVSTPYTQSGENAVSNVKI
jgi:hypothetical protein